MEAVCRIFYSAGFIQPDRPRTLRTMPVVIKLFALSTCSHCNAVKKLLTGR